ncbi:MAG TPA: hypothetical protein VKZ78_05040 [Sphingobacteriaceae bacterium]|nr:hypothetical protein [Sphingobacteriaceae bacterium]
MKIRASFLLLVVGLATVTSAVAQQRKVDGVLRTADGKAVSHATVMLKHQSNRILAFKPSDANGQFQLVVPDTASWSSLFIEVNHLGYAKINQPLENGVNRYEIEMSERAIDLTEIEVRSRPRIDSYGDTLSYDVASFARAEDRTIGDVLKNMPGMEVSESGQIKFNDKAISNLYIDGDDLLADKYAIGTKTIPHAMVQKLEVMQNHQPLKVLRNKTLSDQVAINLVIKEEARLKLTGQAKLGAGLPHQYDGELNTILFNKKYKMLNVAKGNNVGTDLSVDFASIGRFGLSGGSRPSALLSAGIGSPPLPRNRYYLNNSGSLNANNLVNLNNGLQLTTNVHLWLDRNEMEVSHQTEVFATGDTIRYWENQAMTQDPFLTAVTISANSNKDTYYFKNDLRLSYRGDLGRSYLLSNSQDFSQSLRGRMRDFSNDLQYVPELKNKNILNLGWYLNHFNQPQTLLIQPGLNADLLNDGEPFREIDQFAEIPTWYSRLNLAYQLPRGIIRQAYRISSINEFQQLNSSLRLMQDDGSIRPFAGSQDNSLDWRKNELSLSGNYEYKKGRIEATMGLPLIFQHIHYDDAAFNLDVNRARLLFSPSLSTKIKTTAEDYVSFSYQYGENTGSINGIFRGAVLSGYRTLRANDAALQESRGHNGSLHYNFQRSISMLFMNAGINYNRSIANTIASSVMNDNISQTVLIPFDNDISSFGASAGISKYIFALGATTSLKGAWSTSRSNQLLNGESLPYHNETWSVSPTIEARLWKKISTNYQGTGSWTVSRSAKEGAVAAALNRQIRRFDQNVSLSYSPVRAMFFRVTGRHQFVEQPSMEDLSYYFIDAKVRYTLTKYKMDFDLDLSNLANVRDYETFSLTANQFSHSQYQLRGRMAVLKVSFNL